MKHVILSSLLALCAVTGVARAEDQDLRTAPAICGMSFEAKGGGLQILVGEFKLVGEGVIKCREFNGSESVMPVDIQIGGRSPVALKIAAGYLEVYGLATGIGFAKSPEGLAGRYLTVDADAAVGLGAGVAVSLHLKRDDAATINLNLQVARGLGLDVGFNSLTISPR